MNEMKRYTVKSVNVHAFRWPGESASGIMEDGVVQCYRSTVSLTANIKCKLCGIYMYLHGWVGNGDGKEKGAVGYTVCPGDWVILGVHGEYFTCKPDKFAEKYELVCGAKAPVKDEEIMDTMRAMHGGSCQTNIEGYTFEGSSGGIALSTAERKAQKIIEYEEHMTEEEVRSRLNKEALEIDAGICGTGVPHAEEGTRHTMSCIEHDRKMLELFEAAYPGFVTNTRHDVMVANIVRHREELEVEHNKQLGELFEAACPGWGSDGKISSMIENAERYHERLEEQIRTLIDGVRIGAAICCDGVASFSLLTKTRLHNAHETLKNILREGE